MGTIRKIGSDYFIEFDTRGLKYQQKIGPDKKLAEKTLIDIEAKITRGETALIVRDCDLDIFFEDFLKHAQENYTPKTARRFKSLIGHYASFMKREVPSVARLSQVTPNTVDQYKACLVKSRTKPGVVNLTIFLLREIFEYAIKLGYLNDNPVLHIRFLEDFRKPPFILSQNDIEQLLRQSPPPFSQIFETMLLTGMLCDEIVRLKWEDVDFKNRTLKIQSDKNSALKLLPRQIPLQQRVYDVLQDLYSRKTETPYVFTQNGNLSADELKRQFTSVVFGSLPNRKISFLTLRHTFAAHVVQKEISLFTLQKLLGHTDIAMTTRYAPFFYRKEIT